MLTPLFSQQDVVAALNERTRKDMGASLPAQDREFWDRHAGISATDQDVARAAASNADAKALMDSSALTALDVAKLLGLSATTVRHYKSDKKLYSYMVNGRLVFPTWQFNNRANKPIPGLKDILQTLPKDLHPQSVAGFFLAPQPDLVLHGEPASVKEWLEAGGSARAVLELAQELLAATDAQRGAKVRRLYGI